MAFLCHSVCLLLPLCCSTVPLLWVILQPEVEATPLLALTHPLAPPVRHSLVLQPVCTTAGSNSVLANPVNMLRAVMCQTHLRSQHTPL